MKIQNEIIYTKILICIKETFVYNDFSFLLIISLINKIYFYLFIFNFTIAYKLLLF